MLRAAGRAAPGMRTPGHSTGSLHNHQDSHYLISQPLATYLLTQEAQRHSPVRQRHGQHHEVGQQPEVAPELGPPNQVALQREMA